MLDSFNTAAFNTFNIEAFKLNLTINVTKTEVLFQPTLGTHPPQPDILLY